MLARDFGGVAFGLPALLLFIECRALRDRGSVLRVVWFDGLHAGLRFVGGIDDSFRTTGLP
jgi:hypothetical protein